jgi:FkbM family methyltransferase
MLASISERLRLQTRWKRFCTLVEALGVRGAIRQVLPGWLGLRRDSEHWVRPHEVLHPLRVCLRPDSSDIECYHQIFIEREYSCLDDLTDVRLVIDCGANVGYSSAYFLSRFPGCQVVAVEPDPANFAVLQRNLAAYGQRVSLVRAGVWSHKARLVMSQERYRDGREWSKQVRPCGPSEEPDFEGIDVGSLLASSGHDRISLLKMDVEGAEAVIFAENFEPWLQKVDAIAIELHPDSIFGKGPEVFFSAIQGRGFQVSRRGELTICRRQAPAASAAG